MKTFIKEKRKVKLRTPVLIGGFPGLGSVGRIALTYLIKQLNAKQLADLYSPHFPHHILVNSSGKIRLPHAQFYFWKNPNKNSRDIILLTGDSQAQNFEGQYNLVHKILEYAKNMRINTVITVGGYRAKNNCLEPKVVTISPNRELLNKMVKAGATTSPVGNPVVGIAGLTLGLAKFNGIKAICLLGETEGYLPDPETAKHILKVLLRFLDFKIDFSLLDKKIKKASEALKRMEGVQRQMEDLTKERTKMYEQKTSYIS